MYQALYRKYRPTNFSNVAGQKVIIQTLTNAIENKKISHAYLFSGPRGTGKTSIAKILAKIVNCENLDGITPCNKCVSCTQINNKQNTDIIEIDAASNNGVDEIRELRDKVGLVPSYGKYKVYIIDEVHMLTTAAFNALLKTLEEPPKHIIFILATTEPHKIPSTILSRCQRFDFKKISITDIKLRLKSICDSENISIEEDALELIAKLSDGGLRDSIGLLDQLTAYTNDKITTQDVNEVYGTLSLSELSSFVTGIFEKKLDETFELIDKYDSDGKNLNKIMENIIEMLKNTLIYYNSSDYFKSKEEKEIYEKICNAIEEDKIYKIIDILLFTLNNSKSTNNIKLLMELSIIQILNLQSNNSVNLKQEIPILDEKKEIKIEKPIEKKEINENIKKKIQELKKIRINNTLSKFDKKSLISFKNNFEEIKTLLMDPEYSSIVSLIIDGEIKAKGDKDLIIVYNNSNLEECFNSSLIDVEKAFYKAFECNYKPIAVSNEEWEIIKTNFNNSLKQGKKLFEYQEENIDLVSLYKQEEENDTQNEIENMFENIIEYS